MRSSRAWQGLKLSAVVVALLTAGCGDDDDGGAGMAGSSAGGSTANGGSGTSGGSNGGGGTTSNMAGGGSGGTSGTTTGGGGGNSGGSNGGGGAAAGSGGAGGSGGQISGDEPLSATIDGTAYAFARATFKEQAANAGRYDVSGKPAGMNLPSLELSLQADGPGSYECGNTSITFYDAAGRSFHAVASDGSCSIEVTAWPEAVGDFFDATFTGTLVRTGETPKMLTQGVAHVPYQ